MRKLLLFNLMITTGAISVSQALMVNQTLLQLHMAFNDIGDDGITAIAESLNNSTITVLNVKGCGINFVGVKSLAATLSCNKKIKELFLQHNPIKVDGARLVMKSAVDSTMCESVVIGREYEDDDEVKRMMSILEDRRQHVKIYIIPMM